MKILITSAGGLATSLFHALKDEHQVRVLRRRPDPVFGEACMVGDVANMDDVLRAMDGCDLVFHTAVRNNYDLDFNAYPDFLHTNVDGSFNIFYAAARLKTKRIVYSSTSMVLGFQRYTKAPPPGERAVRVHDDTPHAPDCAYSMTKSLAEQASDFFRNEHGVNVIGLRYGWLAPLKRYADPAMLMRTLSFCFHPDDAVAANLLAAKSNATGNYLIAGPTSFNDEEATLLWRNPRAVLEARFPAELAYLDRIGHTVKPIGCWLDCSRAMSVLGYRPQYDFRWYVAQHAAGAFAKHD